MQHQAWLEAYEFWEMIDSISRDAVYVPFLHQWVHLLTDGWSLDE